MKKAILSFLLLGFFTFGLSLFSGCPICKCRPEEPYFDFSNVNLVSETSRIGLGDSLQIRLELQELEYLATSCRSRSGFGALYACSCPEPGRDGAKYPIEEIEITSNQDFSANFPAGSSLNDLFIVSNTYGGGSSAVNDISPITSPYAEPLSFTLSARPDSINLAHSITIQLRKSNGALVSGTTESIVWD